MTQFYEDRFTTSRKSNADNIPKFYLIAMAATFAIFASALIFAS